MLKGLVRSVEYAKSAQTNSSAERYDFRGRPLVGLLANCSPPRLIAFVSYLWIVFGTRLGNYSHETRPRPYGTELCSTRSCELWTQNNVNKQLRMSAGAETLRITTLSRVK